MSIVYLSLGSNLGDKNWNLNQAIQLIGLELGNVLNVSSFYQSKPWGFESDNDFLNAVVVVLSDLTPLELLEKTQSIEKRIGRDKKTKSGYQDRLIDIDILLYDNQIIDLPQLCIPHKYLHKRDFVLIPLVEIASELIHPVLGKSMKELLDELEDRKTIPNCQD